MIFKSYLNLEQNNRNDQNLRNGFLVLLVYKSCDALDFNLCADDFSGDPHTPDLKNSCFPINRILVSVLLCFNSIDCRTSSL